MVNVDIINLVIQSLVILFNFIQTIFLIFLIITAIKYFKLKNKINERRIKYAEKKEARRRV